VECPITKKSSKVVQVSLERESPLERKKSKARVHVMTMARMLATVMSVSERERG